MRWVFAALALGAVAFSLHPGGRARGSMVGRKLLGHSDLSWTETAVRLAPRALQDSLRSRLGFTATPWARTLDYSIDLGELPRLKYDIYYGPTPNVTRLDCHYSVLQAGHTPHPPHLHDDEEIIIPIRGEVDIIRVGDGDGERAERAGPGDLVYHAPNQAHTIHAAGPEPSAYLVLRWAAGENMGGAPAASSVFALQQAMENDLTLLEERRKTVLFEFPTPHLARLHCHLTTLKPGAGSAPHRNDHDVALVVLRGSIETLNQTFAAPAVAFHPALTVHSARNAGSSPAQYLAIEFHDRVRY